MLISETTANWDVGFQKRNNKSHWLFLAETSRCSFCERKQLHEPFEKQTEHCTLDCREGGMFLVTKRRAVNMFVNSEGVVGQEPVIRQSLSDGRGGISWGGGGVLHGAAQFHLCVCVQQRGDKTFMKHIRELVKIKPT